MKLIKDINKSLKQVSKNFNTDEDNITVKQFLDVFPKVYVVRASYGEYDDYHEFLIFATLNKDKAEAYVNKYNRILDKATEHYGKLYNRDNGDVSHLISYRQFTVLDNNYAEVEEI